jgi:hypothetical protein
MCFRLFVSCCFLGCCVSFLCLLFIVEKTVAWQVTCFSRCVPVELAEPSVTLVQRTLDRLIHALILLLQL